MRKLAEQAGPRPAPTPPTPRPEGPGTELHGLLAPLGWPTCGACAELIARMNAGGLDWTREHRAQLVEELLERGRAMGALADVTKWGGTEDEVREFLGNLIDDAIRRAEDKQRRPFERRYDVLFVADSHTGLGDLLMLLAIAEGWQRAYPEQLAAIDPGWRRPWLELFHLNVEIASTRQPHALQINALNGKLDHWHRYDGRNPWQCAAAYAEKHRPGRPIEAVLPAPRPLAGKDLLHRHAGAVVLAPFAAFAIRCWPLMHWLTLEQLLLDAGYRVVILDDQLGRATPFRSPKVIARPAQPEPIQPSAQEVATLLRVAACLVTNESGMGHVAGMLGVPTVCLAAVFKGFSDLYPSVKTLSGGLLCDWCHQDYPKGGLTRHQIGCAGDQCQSLRAIAPARVLEEVRRIAVDQRRRPTMQAFLAHLEANNGWHIVETGCQREAIDYGAGMSTSIFARWTAKRNATLCSGGGRVCSVDNDAAHLKLAEAVAPSARMILSDSVTWLRSYAGPRIDGLYLDSLDTTSPGHAEHCRAELEAALPHLAEAAAVLIDDTLWDAGGWWGKGRLAVPWLQDRGWRIIADGYQVLLSRAAT